MTVQDEQSILEFGNMSPLGKPEPPGNEVTVEWMHRRIFTNPVTGEETAEEVVGVYRKEAPDKWLQTSPATPEPAYCTWDDISSTASRLTVL